MMSAQNYSSVNGHTNVFWGWGREDSDIEHRIHNQHMKIEKPEIFDSGIFLISLAPPSVVTDIIDIIVYV